MLQFQIMIVLKKQTIIRTKIALYDDAYFLHDPENNIEDKIEDYEKYINDPTL